MEYVDLYNDCQVACQKTGKQYTYSFIENEVEITKLHSKQPIEHTKNTEIGRKLFSIISKEPISATSEDERKEKYSKIFDETLQKLQDNLNKEALRVESDAKAEENLKNETYSHYYEMFENNCERYGYTPLQYLVRIFEAFGVNSTLEIFKAYLGYLQTLTGAKGTNVIAIGSQSSGKSHLIENPLDCIPQEYVHKGTYTRASFFTEFAGRDLTHHVFYIGDLGGINDDINTIEFRDTLKALSTDGFVSRNYKEDGEVVTETITGNPAIVYTTVNDEMINEQEKSRSIILMPPSVDKSLLMIYDSFIEAPASDFELKLMIEKSKNLVIGYSWFLMNDFCNIEMYNPYMFAVKEYLNNIDDFNRKIKEFNMLLKLVIILNDGFKLNHQLYYDDKTEEAINTTLMIASKKDVIDALYLFEGSSGLLPTEVALIKGLLDEYACYSDAMDIDYDDDEDTTFEEAVINYNRTDADDPVDLKYVETITDYGTKYFIENWDHGYKCYNNDIDDYDTVFVWFTVPKIKAVFKNRRWYRNVSKKISEKLLKLHEFGMLIKVGKTEQGANVYGINYGVEELINNIEPNWGASAIKNGIEEFHRKYPLLSDEFDEFFREDRKSQIKHTDMEIKDGGLYDLPWR